MLEKFKDFLYETSDLLLALAIILVMSSVITWQVTDSLAFNNQNNITEGLEQTFGKSNSLPTTGSSDDLFTEDDIDKPDSPVEDANELSSNPPAVNPVIVEPISPPVQKAVEPTMVSIQIPNGTPGAGIANILKGKGLIEDSGRFIARVEELNLAMKLKSGSYKIESGSSLDDIIYIITGQKRQ